MSGEDRVKFATDALADARLGRQRLTELDPDAPATSSVLMATRSSWTRVLRYADDEEVRAEATAELDRMQLEGLVRRLAKTIETIDDAGFGVVLDDDAVIAVAEYELAELKKREAPGVRWANVPRSR